MTLGVGALRAPQEQVEAFVTGEHGAVAAAVARHGGTVTDELEIIEGSVVRVPAGALDALASEPGVTSVDAERDASFEAVLPGTTYDPVTQAGSMYTTAQLTGATSYWAAGYTGAGVDVALVDTGVQPSTFLGTRLVAGTDVSGEGNALTDGFGHGTHMAGIIAGAQGTPGASQSFNGMAPGARVISVKVAGAAGATNVVKILQGLDWVYTNRNAGGRNIRVVNLSVGLAAMPNYVNDPLSTAVEKLWNNGVIVVAAAGNIGPGFGLVAPAYDPYVIAVGALDTKGTVSGTDDAVASFSAGAQTDSGRRPDILAPGRSIQSLMASGSATAAAAPSTSKIGTSFVVGSGTSQAAAVVAGAMALIVQELPAANPSSQKIRMTSHSSQMSAPNLRNIGWGKINLTITLRTTAGGGQSFTPATASTAGVSVANDGATRDLGPQGSQWLGSQWLGSFWMGSTWR
jgi:serine protease AprX